MFLRMLWLIMLLWSTSCTRSLGTRPEARDCTPVDLDEERRSFESHEKILPGGYTVVAVSADGRRAVGTMRLFRSSPADSGLSYSGEWVHAAPGDTLVYPLYGVTTVDFQSTTVDTTASLDELGRHIDPIYPQVLVERRPRETSGEFYWRLYIDTVRHRGPGFTTDGMGVWTTVTELRVDRFRGWHWPFGIVVTDHGFYCAWRLPSSEPRQ